MWQQTFQDSVKHLRRKEGWTFRLLIRYRISWPDHRICDKEVDLWEATWLLDSWKIWPNLAISSFSDLASGNPEWFLPEWGLLRVASEALDLDRFGFSFIWHRSSLRKARKKYVFTFLPNCKWIPKSLLIWRLKPKCFTIWNGLAFWTNLYLS